MKILLFFIAGVSCTYTSSLGVDFPSLYDWETYKIIFKKYYPDPAEDTKRRGIFEHWKKIIAEHNKEYLRGKSNWTAGINQFTDLTEEEMIDHGVFRPKIPLK